MGTVNTFKPHLPRLSSFLLIATALAVSTCGGSSSAESEEATELITPTNSAPIAEAGTDQSVTTNSLVTLDASASSDPDGDNLIYSWAFSSQPSGSNLVLSDAGAINPTFTPAQAGDYILSLTVNDGIDNSWPDTVSITATNQTRSFPIVDTNQSSCYDSASGQNTTCVGTGYDADYAGNQPSYTLSQDRLTVTAAMPAMYPLAGHLVI